MVWWMSGSVWLRRFGRMGVLPVVMVGCLAPQGEPPAASSASSGSSAAAGGGADLGPRQELTDQDCRAEPPGNTPPFDPAVADGMLNKGAQRAFACGLRTEATMDIQLVVTFGPAGCVSDVRLEHELPSALGECLIRRFRDTKIAPFHGEPVSARVRMTNDRVYWQWEG